MCRANPNLHPSPLPSDQRARQPQFRCPSLWLNSSDLERLQRFAIHCCSLPSSHKRMVPHFLTIYSRQASPHDPSSVHISSLLRLQAQHAHLHISPHIHPRHHRNAPNGHRQSSRLQRFPIDHLCPSQRPKISPSPSPIHILVRPVRFCVRACVTEDETCQSATSILEDGFRLQKLK